MTATQSGHIKMIGNAAHPTSDWQPKFEPEVEDARHLIHVVRMGGIIEYFKIS